MAAVSTIQYAKRKNVYGKPTKSTWNTTNVDSFFGNDDEDELATSGPASKAVARRQMKVESSYPVKKANTKPHTSKSAKARPTKKDTFDIPSSDDESDAPAKIVLPPRIKPTRLVDDRKETNTHLTPWERNRLGPSRGSTGDNPKVARKAVTVSEAQPQLGLLRRVQSPESKQDAATTPNAKSRKRGSGDGEESSGAGVGPGTSSAAARLAARKRLAEAGAVSQTNELLKFEGTPRKRMRMEDEPVKSQDDVLMADTTSNLVCDTPLPESECSASDDIWELPDSSADESMKRKSHNNSPKAVSKTTRRSNSKTYVARSTPSKGVSAPARLTEMLPTESDSTDAPTRSPSASTLRRHTPQKPTTPPGQRVGSPETTIRAAGMLTPKQAQLWSKLLPSDPIAPSPSALPLKDLSISANRTTAPLNSARTLTRSSSDVPRRHTRLVDRLKASAASSDEALSSDDDDSATAAGLVVQSQPSASPLKPTANGKVPVQASQSQSQGSAILSGPKITYSRMRSYLPEDNLEDDLMLGLTNDTPEQPRASRWNGTKSTLVSQKSAFDIDESDEEAAGTRRIRNIHELRAAGRNIRGMEDIEELLNDIENHSASSRSRRRSALIDLATKLADKTFVERFVAHSFEIRLAAECGAVADEVGDFVLASAIALIMATEPPEHSVRSLQDHAVMSWLAQLLNHDVEVGKLARDRRSNMSKAAQGIFLTLIGLLNKHPSFWSDNIPTSLSTGLIALKALDQLIGRLCRLGDRSELLNAVDIQPMLGHSASVLGQRKPIHRALAISIMESLSTTTPSLDWPAETVRSIGEVLPSLNETADAASATQHTQFLALRLCLNLTNNNVRNCALFAAMPAGAVVGYLLQAITSGFREIDAIVDDETRKLAFDLLVLAIGIMINFAEACDEARESAFNHPDTLAELVTVFRQGQKRMLDAESVEESTSNVAFGYLAMMLANLCQHSQARTFIASKLPNQRLAMLVDAVEEFVLHHQKVDTMNFEGEEGQEVWGAFTEKLRLVLARLKEVEGET